VVQDDQVARLEVEAVQAVAGALGVVHVFIDDVGRALSVGCDALADLPGGNVLANAPVSVKRVAPGGVSRRMRWSLLT
jgi:hypothetical protein